MIAGVTRGMVERERKWELGKRGEFMFGDWTEGQVVCHFKLATDMVKSGIKEFAYDADGPAYLKREY